MGTEKKTPISEYGLLRSEDKALSLEELTELCDRANAPVVARGSYHYHSEGSDGFSDAGVSETWAAAVLGEAIVVVVDRNAPKFGMRILVTALLRVPKIDLSGCGLLWEALRRGSYQSIRCRLEGDNENHGSVARFTMGGSPPCVRCWRQLGGAGTDANYELRALPPGSMVLPLMRVFAGFTIRGIERMGGNARVFLPNISSPMSPTLFAPLFETREAVRVSTRTESLYTAGRCWDVEKFLFRGKSAYQDASEWAVDQKTGLVVQYSAVIGGQRWRATLVEYEEEEKSD